MIIQELILFRSKDKTPYNFKNDPIFALVTPSTSEKQLIDELSLLSYDFRYNECRNLQTNYEVNFGQENKLPYPANSNEYNFTISGVVGTQSKIFSTDDRLEFSDLASNRFQAIFKTSDGDWFILYADLTLEETPITNQDVTFISLAANNVKEELYRISTFNLIPSEAQFINTDSEGNILLDSNNNLTINIDGTLL